LRNLTSAKAKVVVFDVEFINPSQKFDPDFAAAIQEAERAGTKVVLGGYLEGEDSQLQVTTSLQPAIGNHLGIVDGGTLEKPSDSRFIRLVGEKENPEAGPEERPIIPSISLLAVSLYNYPNEETTTWYHPLASEVRLRNRNGELLETIPVDNQQALLVELVDSNDMPHKTYEEVFDNFPTYATKFKGTIVIIGYQEGDSLKAGDRYGVEMHANAISALLGRTYIRQLPFLYHFATIVGLIALCACLQIRCGSWMSHKLTIPIPIVLPAPFDKIQIPTAIVVIFFIYGLTALLAFKWGHTLLSMSYHLAALILTYVLFVLFRSRLTVQ
jgi:CHASE2 domain-containing sensor protein